VAYRDLAAVPRGKTSGGFLPQAVVCGGQVIGTWKVRKDREGVEVALTRGRTPCSFHDRDLEKAIERYRTFAGIGTRR
jgi:Winged helix DNA-binding domain